MKKAAAAALLMLTMAGVAIWNIRYVHRFTSSLTESIELSRSLWASGDPDGAEKALKDALDQWFYAEPYTHVFIRHSEVNDVTDAFYDVFAALREDSASADSQYDRLEAHLKSIDEMEHVTVKSIF